ncbi:hypothetical protein [Streptomyces sp. NPDC055189]
MTLSGLHRRLLADVLAIGSPHPLVVTACSMLPEEIQALRTWALEWVTDLDMRLHSESEDDL